MKTEHALDKRTRDFKRISQMPISKMAQFGYEQEIAKELVCLRFKDLFILFDICEN